MNLIAYILMKNKKKPLCEQPNALMCVTVSKATLTMLFAK